MFILTAIGERGVMKKKVVGLALALSLLGGLLGACDQGGGGGGTGTEGGTSPSPAESPSPATSP